MGRSFLKQTAEILRTKQRRKHLKRAMVSLSVIVAMLTSYLLILPAVTMERDPICGQEEHTHTDECYEHRLICGKTEQDGQAETTQRVLSCAFTTHVHGESCYNADGQLVCGYADYAIHTHDENCYDADGNLVCTLPEVKQHGHDGSCYATETVLACGQEESSVQTIEESSDPFGDGTDVFGSGDNNVYVGDSEGGHIHTEECYETKYTLVCGMNEVIPHTHTAECYDENGNLVCGRLEIREHQHDEDCFMTVTTEAVEGHTHTDECYEDVLICDKAEHVHTEECYPQEEAEDEVAEGDAEAADENADEAVAEETGEEVAGDTAAEEPVEDENNEEETAEEDAEELEVDAEGTDEETGDVSEEEIQEDADTVEDTETPSYVCGLEEHVHTEECLDEEENVICGLEEHVHTDECLAAEDEEDAELVAMEPEVSKVLTAEGSDYTVEVTYTDEAQIPDNAVLSVREIEQGTEEYESYYQQAVEAVQGGDTSSLAFARFFDISFVVDGTEIEPEAAVAVKISYKDAVDVPEGSEVKSVHFGEETEVLDVQTNGADGTVEEVEFDANGFSVYGIVGTETISASFTASDGNTYEVTVNFGKDAGIPANAKLVVSEVGENSSRYDGYVEQAADAINARAIDLQYVKLLDISIVDENGNKVELNAPVDVQIKLLDKDQTEESTQVVHFEGTNETPVVMDSTVEGDAVNFSTDGFSIYAVVDVDDTSAKARMTIEFYDHEGKLLETAYVKNDDTLAEIVEIVSDPNPNVPSGKLFKGWMMNKQDYTVDDADSAMTLGQIREWAEAKYITENETVKFYSVIYSSFKVTYKDGDQIIVGTENNLYPYTTASIPYTVNMAYTAPDDTHNFEGWLAVDGRSNITSASYVNEDGDTITIDTSDPQAIYPNGASLTITGNVTFGVSAPEGHWLVFHENGKNATYNAPQFIKKTETTNDPGDPERYGYTFGGWYTDEECTAGHEFTFGGTIDQTTHIFAKWTARPTAPYTIIIWKQNVSGNGYDFEETVTGTGNVGSNIPLGNTVSRNYTGFHLKETPTAVQIVPEGNAVVNVYYDRTEYTLNFQIEGYVYTKSNESGWYSERYGTNDDGQTYFRIYYINGAWRTSDNINGTIYEGTKYSRSSGWQTIKAITALYEQNIADNFPIVGTNGITYDNGERWDPQSNNQGWSEVMVFIETMPAESVNFHLDTADRPLKTMYYYVEALPTDTQNVVTRGGTRYVLYNTISALYNGVTAEDYIDLDGFTKKDVATSVNGTALILGQNTYDSTFYIYNNNQNQSIYFFYTRDKYKINYMDGVYVDGNGNKIDESKEATWGTSVDILYQADISSYNKGGSNYKVPTKPGYVFDGWYIDDACTTPYTFDKMPKGGVTVYAKWRQIQYRVFLHPNVPESDTTLSWGDDDLPEDQKQQMNFCVSLGETVSAPTGTRGEYEMVGWYLDEACTQLFNADNYILNETSVTQAYDKTTHMTDKMNKYGNIIDESTAYNSDVNRDWIQKEFNIYAKWRKVIDGAEGIGVVYNAGEGSGTPPTDSSLYLDTASATALTAGQLVPPTPAEGSDISEYVFDYWVLQTWDEHQQKYVDTSTYIYPGDTFIVLLDNAKKEAKLDDDGNQIVVDNVAQWNYTVQLRAEYVPKDIATPTHIDWYANNGTGASVSDSKDGKLKINEPVDIRQANTFSYPGHKFLGWARIEDTEEGEHPDLELDEDDLWLIYDETTGEFKVKQDGTTELRTVTQIAADERNPYHDLYAVWETLTYKVSIQKTVVDGTPEDENTAFTIAYDYDNASLEDGSVQRKHVEDAIVISESVPYGTIVTVSETGYPAFEQSYSASKTSNDKHEAITPEAIAPETEGGGDFKITGDTIITVTNTRKVQDVVFGKTLEESQIDGDTSLVTTAEFTLTDGTNTYTATPESDGTVTFTGVLFGTYTLNETATPTGYAAIPEHTVVVDENGYSIQLNRTDIAVDGVYIINDPKAKTGSFTLVKTNEDGSKQLEGAIFEISAYDSESQRYLNPKTYDRIGNREITELKLGTKYQLKEIQSPDGYILLGDVYFFQIKLDGTVQITDENGTVITDYSDMKISLNDKTISVKNEPGQALPHTGGSGTLPYTLSGIALMLGAALMYGFRMRRRERRLN